MKKLCFVFFLFFVFFFSFTQSVQASILILRKDGEVVWTVLSENANSGTTGHSFIEVRNIAKSGTSEGYKISLRRKENGVSLTVFSDEQEKELDVSNLKDNLIEIEERPEVRKMNIVLSDGKFAIISDKVKALTDFPILVDPKTANIMVETPSGKRYLSFFPYEAVGLVLRTKLVDRVDTENIEISEEKSVLCYKIDGQKIFDFFGLYEYAVPVSYKISASTGEIVSFDAPGWLKILNILFT